MMTPRYSSLFAALNQNLGQNLGQGLGRGFGLVGVVALILLTALPAIAGYDPPARQSGPGGGSTVAGAGER